MLIISCEDYLVPVSCVGVGVYETVNNNTYDTVGDPAQEETDKAGTKNNHTMCKKEIEKDGENQEDTNNPRYSVIAYQDGNNDEEMKGGTCAIMEDSLEERSREEETPTSSEDEEFQMNGRITEQKK